MRTELRTMGSKMPKELGGKNEVVKAKAVIPEEELLKRAICDTGVNAIEEFLGHPLDSDDINIDAEMNDCIANMPDDVYQEYLEQYINKKSKPKYYVTMKVEARYIVAVEADSINEAKEKADEAFQEADFGEAEDISA